MKTELIFGAALKKDTPNDVIETLKYMIGEIKEKPAHFPLPDGICEWLFQGGSYYFPINNSLAKMWLEDVDKKWRISTRSSIENHENEIETFLEWIKPYIDSGSGGRELYAITIGEVQDTPTLHYLYE